MILEFEVSNILSFEKNQKFSLVAGSSRAEVFKENVIFEFFSENNKKNYVLNSAMVYGSNASGKSNLFHTLDFLKDLVTDSDEDIHDPEPFKFNSNTEPSYLKIKFLQKLNEITYELNYSISLMKDGTIVEEVLSVREILQNKKKGKEKVLFERKEDEFLYFDEDLEVLIEKFKTDNIEKKVVLSLLINDVNKTYFKDTIQSLGYQLVKLAYNFFDEKMVFGNQKRNSSTIARLMKDNNFKEKVLNALNEIDNSIADFKVIDITENLAAKFLDLAGNNNDREIPEFIAKEVESIRKNRVLDFQTIHRISDEDYPLEYHLESSGTRKFINEFIDLIDCIENNKVYIIDEVENHYHEFIQQYVVNLFLNQEEGGTAQIVAITHNPDFLDPLRFSKEQIWFVEKDRKTQSSFLYRLADFKEVTYNNHNWKSIYLQGRLGAVPKVIM